MSHTSSLATSLGQQITTKQFAEQWPFFTWDEFRNSVGVKETTGYARLKDAVRKGYINRLGKGVYVSRVGPWMERPPSPLLLPSFLAKDAVLCYHAALDALGHGHTQFFTVNYCSREKRRKSVSYGNYSIKQVTPKSALVLKQKTDFGVIERQLEGRSVRVTGRERTMVDCLDRLDLAGGAEEVFRSIGTFPYIKFEILLEYLRLQNKSSLYAKTGYLLDSYRNLFNFSQEQEQKMLAGVAGSYAYLGPRRSGYRFISKWRLLVPPESDSWVEA